MLLLGDKSIGDEVKVIVSLDDVVSFDRLAVLTVMSIQASSFDVLDWLAISRSVLTTVVIVAGVVMTGVVSMVEVTTCSIPVGRLDSLSSLCLPSMGARFAISAACRSASTC